VNHCRAVFVIAALASALLSAAQRAEADVVVRVDRASQTMDVSIDGTDLYRWPVSTAKPGYLTPPGVFHPQWMVVRWFSRIYDNSPMPHSIFYYSGFAIHGSYETRRLGAPASHGCIRLHPDNAAILYDLIEREGMKNTTIIVQ